MRAEAPDRRAAVGLETQGVIGGEERSQKRQFEAQPVSPVVMEPFELTNIAGQKTARIMKNVVMVGGYQAVEVDFVANDPGLTLFHCHQQLHMDFGFMTLSDYL